MRASGSTTSACATSGGAGKYRIVPGRTRAVGARPAVSESHWTVFLRSTGNPTRSGRSESRKSHPKEMTRSPGASRATTTGASPARASTTAPGPGLRRRAFASCTALRLT